MRILLLAACILFSKCLLGQQTDSTFKKLLDTPDLFHDQVVELIGYVNFEFEGDYIYLDTINDRNRIWIDELAPSLLRKKYFGNLNGRRVILKGRYDKNRKGHFGLFKGTITDVTRLDVL